MKQTKNKMIDSAIILFADKGVQATSIRDITEACGLSKGAFYNHFPTKESLLTHIIEDHINVFQSEVQRTLTISNPQERLKQQIFVQFDYIQQHQELFIILNREKYSWFNEDIENYFNEIDKQILNLFQESIQAVHSECTLQQTYSLSFILNSQIVSYTLLLLDGNEMDLNLMVTSLLNLIKDIKDGMISRNESGPLPLGWLQETIGINETENSKMSFEEIFQQVYEQIIQMDDATNKSQWIEALKCLQRENGQITSNSFVLKSILSSLLKEPELKSVYTSLTRLLTEVEKKRRTAE
ncbi:TetR/AcrR family transcriptional regulator [Bacillus sp. mrc49]|uniref:TetR/AcrR family transcriptional regulator n=1 Tax=Bacillus sp. mrc49 TaxID=2054913 RepID=UPI000C27E224|nr:TetR/AcrR family transcriptional regulator [Bacillus sp. mrc49]PJN90677.1 hypothetical protein CVN76_09165 [Bacillus sp. mrc49]